MKSVYRKYLCALAVSIVFTAGVRAHSTSGGYSTWDLTLFGGYQWAKQQGSVKPLTNPIQPNLSLGGREFGDDVVAGVRLTQDFFRYLAMEEGFTYALLPVRYTAYGTQAQASLDAKSYRASFNPVLHFTPREARVRPFVTVGVAANWFDPHQDSLVGVSPASVQYTTKLQTKIYPDLLYGVGVKFNISRRFGIRIDARDHWSSVPHFELPDYPPAVGAYYSPKGQTLHQVEVSGGIFFRFGYKEPAPPPAPPPPPPPPPPSFSVDSVTASATDVCPGAVVELRAATTGVPADATYRWTVNGSPITATGPTASVNTTGMSGTQKVLLTVEAGPVSKSGSTSFNIKPGGNPAISVSVSPSTIEHGATAAITPTATGTECGGQVRTACTASEGSVTGTTFDSSNVAFDPNATKAQSKTITITCTATDSLGGTASGNATVTVTEKPKARRLDDLVFAKGSARVNNCAKRLLLEEVTALLRDNPDWTLVLVGHRDEQETGRTAATLDRSRTMNAAAVLSAGTGICPSLDLSRVKFIVAGTAQGSQPRPSFCGASTQVKERAGQAVSADDPRAQFRRVEVWLIPLGADTPDELKAAQPIAADAVKPLGCPK